MIPMWVWFIIFSSLYVCIYSTVLFCSSNKQQISKRLFKKVLYIYHVINKGCLPKETDFITVSNKGAQFRVSVSFKEIAEAKSLNSSSHSVYRFYNVFINDELVCRLHILESKDNILSQHLIEMSDTRKEAEIAELIKLAYKSSKQVQKKYYKNVTFTSLDLDKKSSFYDLSSK
jgi:hypothetical protein